MNPLRPMIGIDGEGIRQPEQDYCLLAAGAHRWIGTKSPGGLSTEECFEFLLSLPRGGKRSVRPIYIWFAFDYDVNMMLRDIPLRGDNSIQTLKETNKLYWRGYSITYIRRKILRIRRGARLHTSVDVWGFFQSSFENACADWKVEIPTIIGEGKAARAKFDSWSLARIREYNAAELVGLAEIAEKLRDAAAPLALPVQSWHGPAALAGAWLQKNKVKRWLPDETNQIPTPLRDVATRAYFGGRIDVQGYGIIDPCYHYDIVSAYPAGIANLPDLSNLKWIRQGKGKPSGKLYVARIKWQIPETYWPPFPWRAINGSIRYPLEGEGWYWNYEIETALEKFGAKHFTIEESWNATGEITYPFHQLIHETFNYRKQLKAAGNPSHKAVRLVLNSLYGKFAQTVGTAKYHSPIWAGMITSQTRAQLLSQLSDDVVCVMTDSIWSRSPLELPSTNELGGWEQGDENKLILAEAGLYKAFCPDGTSHVWQRGFDKRNPVDIEGLVDAWLAGNCESPVYNVNRFIGYGLALHTSYPWRTWQTLERRIEPVPMVGTTKRKSYFPRSKDANISADSFIPLPVRERDGRYISQPYSKLTTDDQLVALRLQDECEEE